MPFVQAGNIKLHYVEHGAGNNIIVFIHGYLGCVQWMDLIWPRLPKDIHVFALDWRGCGDSEKPVATNNFGNYSIKQHAEDMIAAIKALGIKRCSLATHSTGGIISTYMLLDEPEIFDKVLALDPVSPTGLLVPESHSLAFPAIKESRNFAFKFLSFAAPTLFIKESLSPGVKAQFKQETSAEQKELFNLIVDKARALSDGAGAGTLYHLRDERIRGTLAKETYRIKQPTLVLWGEEDTVIPREDTDETVKLLPNCKLQIIENAGHSLTLENPDLYTRIFVDFFQNE